ncbi:MAG: S1 RNA-binding domain-containing protein, partial [Actinobacteria bacterium]|nr:S1 RNA-binding domain-containing protein [Actinomycetota bacterium]
MARGHVDTPEQVTSVGESIHVKVQEVDLDRRRISLSMRAAGEALGTVIEMPPRDASEFIEDADAEEASATDEAPEAAEPAAEEAAEAPETEE